MGRCLALAAGAATARQAGRVEDEAALRDAVLLTRPGDDVGRMLLAWRWLAAELLTEANLAAVLEAFGNASSDETVSDLATRFASLAPVPRRSGC